MNRRRTGERGRQPRPPITQHNTRPRLTLLDAEQKHQVHQYALALLHRTGVRVDSPRVLRFLEKKLGGRADADVLRFPAEVVEDALRTAPKTIDVYDRRGEHVFRLGD